MVLLDMQCEPVLRQTASDTMDERSRRLMACDFNTGLLDSALHPLPPCALQQYPLLPCRSFLALNDTLVARFALKVSRNMIAAGRVW